MRVHPSAATPNLQAGRPSAFTSGAAILLSLALARVVLYFFAAPNYGYFRDEFYYIACARHLAFGYVDQPPLIAWIAWLVLHTLGASLWALRLLPTLADCATILLAGLIARELGGRRWAIFLAALAALVAPIFLGMSQFFTMNAFDPPLWTAIAYLLIRIHTTRNDRLWLPIGVLVGITILNKYEILFWTSGLILGLAIAPIRCSLRHRWFWIAAAIAALIALPNFLWQWHNHFPFLEFERNVRAEGRDLLLAPLAFLQQQAQMLGYVAAILVLGALAFFFSRSGRPFRALGIAYLVFLAEMMALHGKLYYVAPVYPALFAAGAVWLDSVTRARALLWAKPVLALGIAAVSAVYAPTILPILSVPHYLAYTRALHIQQPQFENQRLTVLPQLYADMFGWQPMVRQVAALYHALPPAEQPQTAIFGNDYGESGAIDFFGPRYGLPPSIGGHETYWLWGPRQYTGSSLIVLGEHRESRMRDLCTTYTVLGHTDDPLSLPNEHYPIYLCRGLHPGLQTLWPSLKQWR